MLNGWHPFRANQAFFSTVFLKAVDESNAPTLELPTEPVDGSIPADQAERTNKQLFPSLTTLSKVDASRINVRTLPLSRINCLCAPPLRYGLTCVARPL